RVTRVSALTGSTRRGEAMAWTALRSITDEDPINFEYPLARTALIIKATDQLNRVVDELNADVSSYVTSYTGTPGTWSEAVSSNPADLFRHVLQGNANARPLADARIDIDGLQDWHDFCATKGFEFNMIRDFQSSVWDTLSDIASVGRASPTQIDGKWSVVVDKEQTAPVQHFTPRNSFGFEAEKGFPDQPHALRIRFPNRNKNFEQDERIVYNDGYTEANATKFESIDGLGITDPDHIWKYGRFHLAQAAARPERWTFNVDFENLVATRGDLVLVTHDVLLVGLQSGRISSLITSGGNVTGFVSDQVLTMEAGNDYGVSIRTVSDAEVSKGIVTNAGDQTTITFSTPFATGTVAEGDLFAFGILGSETIEGLMLSIEPSVDLAAKVICIPYSSSIYSADTGA
ncbi:MAG: host specificity factor TipJ family phage tail protein, partial [Henriciella sp.]